MINNNSVFKFSFLLLFLTNLTFANEISRIGTSLKTGDGSPKVSDLKEILFFSADSSKFYKNLNSSIQPDIFEEKVLRGASSINVYRKGAYGTVLVVTPEGNGSGVIITNKAHIITNQHVVGKHEKVLIFFKKNLNEELNPDDGIFANVLKVDEVSDLALLYVPANLTPTNMRPIPLSDKMIEVGADAHAIGHPSQQLWTYTKGYISQIRNNFTWNSFHEADVLQIQTPINPGNSGGPLLNSYGELIGINSFKDLDNDSMNFAVANSSINQFLTRKESRFIEKNNACELTEVGDSFRIDDKDLGPSFVQNYDLDCDGKFDASFIVPDNSQLSAITEIDSNKDDIVDIILFDENRDGKINYSLIDSNYDGKVDKKGIHTSGELIPDRFESIS